MAKKKKRKPDSAYWKKRFTSLEASQNAYAAKTTADIVPGLEKAQRQVQASIEKWVSRFAKNNKLSMTEARKQLSTNELAEFKWNVLEYIEKGNENTIDSRWMKELENASAKFHVSRLQAMQIDIQQAIEVAYGNELDEIDAMMKHLYSEGYYHSIFEIQKGFNVGFNVDSINQEKLERILSNPWAADGKTFSSRIWTSKAQMLTELQQQLVRQCAMGKAPDDAIKTMSKFVDKKFKNAKVQAGRLVMTEEAFISSATQKDAFKELGVEEFEVVATLDTHTSDICQDMDGQHFPMSQYEIGSTAPPFHVWCRSTTVPYFDDEWSIGERAARNNDGKTTYVPSDLSYSEWYDRYINDGDDIDMEEIIDVSESKTLSEKIEEIKKKIIENGGKITEDDIKKAGELLLNDLRGARLSAKNAYDDAVKAFETSDIKKEADKLSAKIKSLNKQYMSSSLGDEAKSLFTQWKQVSAEHQKLLLSDEYKNLQHNVTEQQFKYVGKFEDNVNELANKLAEFRSVGIGEHNLNKEHYLGRSPMRDIVTKAYSHYPSDWVDASVAKDKLKISKVQRGYYTHGELAISGDSINGQLEAAMHECGHRFEEVVDGVLDAEKNFYNRRTEGCELEWLGNGYDKSEKTRKDDFLDPYMGKDYGGEHYELVSMGFEMAYTNPTELWNDEDFAQFIYGVLSLF